MTNLFPAGTGVPQLPEGLSLQDTHAMLSPATRALFPEELLNRISEMLASSIVYTFAWAIVPAVLALIASFFMGRKKLDVTAETTEGYTAGH
ncbi:Multidrug resistance protein 3 [compost metagenome]